MAEGITALVLGGSGEIGKMLVKELHRNLNFSRIILITRRNLNMSWTNRLEERVVDFENLDEYKEAFQGADVGYCCLGTTRGKVGPQGFVRVDRDYVAHAAQLLKDQGCRHFHLVSSQGSNKDSNFLYLKTKGEVEELVTAIGFPRVSIYRPSVLLCDREENRPLEKFAQVMLRGFDWRNKFSIETETVAHAMICNTLEEQLQEKAGSAVEIIDNLDILRLGID